MRGFEQLILAFLIWKECAVEVDADQWYYIYFAHNIHMDHNGSMLTDLANKFINMHATLTD